MTGPTHAERTDTTGFHEGELAVQRLAGVSAAAARLSGMAAPGRLGLGAARFLAERTFAALTARDADGTLWLSPLTGPPGFLHTDSPTTLAVRTRPAEGDPLRDLPADQPVGLIAIEFALRRRLRVNGTLSDAGPRGLRVDVEQAFGNCPQYIQARRLRGAPVTAPGAAPVRRGTDLAPEDVDLIRRSDTFLLGTTHPTRGNDASHRGGAPGFVRVEDGKLWFPDYPGNNMFTTLGNLRADPDAALLFSDFATGRTLHLSGRAEVEWTAPGVPGDDGRTGRRVHFTPRQVRAGHLLPLRAGPAAPAPDNPPLTAP
ncbi:pyridoxamine 5'-phosphate oxidase family protein [Saccharothrix sp. 6-C]|uniref:pyridoxamine 5'-phosphate oxidase family protein n=1 Tax=Saccharothrix sp. 6-C TaxID=2781735 RepID=UPI001917201C|nr:pyridoxamine 5'-phosphate oxidase family protein [Saccharothrix sp. 6-C]QQQ74258.1 pyridoxamine 5'-phosphate oxidase family protein [Saccharothrix sp. 6-C]